VPKAFALVASGALCVEPLRMSLADVEKAWSSDQPGKRLVITL